MGESARRRLERDRDGHRRRRKSRREAERAVRVVVLATAVRLLRGRHRRALLRGRQRRRARRRADDGVAVAVRVFRGRDGRGRRGATGLRVVVRAGLRAVGVQRCDAATAGRRREVLVPEASRAGRTLAGVLRVHYALC